jgi:hypothetical protein
MSHITIEASYLMEPSGLHGQIELDPKVWDKFLWKDMAETWKLCFGIATKLCRTTVCYGTLVLSDTQPSAYALKHCVRPMKPHLKISSCTQEGYKEYVEFLNRIIYTLQYRYGHCSFRVPPKIEVKVRTTFGSVTREQQRMPSLPTLYECE